MNTNTVTLTLPAQVLDIVLDAATRDATRLRSQVPEDEAARWHYTKSAVDMMRREVDARRGLRRGRTVRVTRLPGSADLVDVAELTARRPFTALVEDGAGVVGVLVVRHEHADHEAFARRIRHLTLMRSGVVVDERPVTQEMLLEMAREPGMFAGIVGELAAG